MTVSFHTDASEDWLRRPPAEEEAPRALKEQWMSVTCRHHIHSISKTANASSSGTGRADPSKGKSREHRDTL